MRGLMTPRPQSISEKICVWGGSWVPDGGSFERCLDAVAQMPSIQRHCITLGPSP